MVGRNAYSGFQTVRGFAQEAPEGEEAEEAKAAGAPAGEAEEEKAPAAADAEEAKAPPAAKTEEAKAPAAAKTEEAKAPAAAASAEADDVEGSESDEEDTAADVEQQPDDTEATKKLLELIKSATPPIPVLEKWIRDGNKLSEAAVLKIHSKVQPRFRYKLISWALKEKPFGPSEKILLLALSGAKKAKKLNFMRATFNTVDQAYKTPPVCSAMVDIYVQMNDIRNADSLLGTYTPNTAVPYNSVMALHFKLGDNAKAVETYNKMKKAGVKPSKATIYLLLKYKGQDDVELDRSEMEAILEEGMEKLDINRKVQFQARDAMLAYSYLGDPQATERIWGELEKLSSSSGGSLRISVWISGIEAFGELGRMEKVEEIMEKVGDRARKQNSFYPVLIRVYVRNDLMEKAEELIRKVREEEEGDKGVFNFRMYVEVIEAYLKRGDREKALEKMKEVRDSESLPYDAARSLLPLHGKLKDVEGAEALMSSTKRASLYAYNKLLKVYIDSEKRPPPDFIQRMQKAKVKPNEDTHKLLKKAESINSE